MAASSGWCRAAFPKVFSWFSFGFRKAWPSLGGHMADSGGWSPGAFPKVFLRFSLGFPKKVFLRFWPRYTVEQSVFHGISRFFKFCFSFAWKTKVFLGLQRFSLDFDLAVQLNN